MLKQHFQGTSGTSLCNIGLNVIAAGRHGELTIVMDYTRARTRNHEDVGTVLVWTIPTMCTALLEVMSEDIDWALK